MGIIKRATDLGRFFTDRSFITDGPDYRAEKQPDGRVQLHAQRKAPRVPLTCFPEVTIEFTGISDCVGVCIDTTAYDGSSRRATSYGAINSSYVLPNVPTDPGPPPFPPAGKCLWSLGPTMESSFDSFSGSSSCSGTPTSFGPGSVAIFVGLDKATGTWIVHFIGFFGSAGTVFSGSSAPGNFTSPVTISSILSSCGNLDTTSDWVIGDYDPMSLLNRFAFGHGGTATITW